MKLSLLIGVFAACCVAIPLSEVNDPTTNLSSDVALVERDDAPGEPDDAPGEPDDDPIALDPIDLDPPIEPDPPVELDGGHEPHNTSLAIIGARDARTNPPCPAGQTWDRSICWNSGVVRRWCRTASNAPGDGANGYCEADEVCVQRNLSNGKTFADCILLVNLIKWRSGPDGYNEGCTSVISKRGKTHSLGTMAYDTNSKPIQVGKIRFLGEPGDLDEGIYGAVSYAASDWFNFDGGRSMKTCVMTMGATNLHLFSWLF
ncbi:hypothetical protein ONS95_008708 [Cadophora gregata]|uniref:uncharacterized protein n=1 Tax=Cadophora gregata TaxID=51156 RepID=UPI0026DC4570|nr:uncharacterized protein ONS95_008708 [Cadophora gregata]KAK0123698.1 hypothetical protein ONS95_008708 [Cadophora gregata]